MKNRKYALYLAIAAIAAASIYVASRYMGGGTGEAAEGESPLDSVHASLSKGFEDEPLFGDFRESEGRGEADSESYPHNDSSLKEKSKSAVNMKQGRPVVAEATHSLASGFGQKDAALEAARVNANALKAIRKVVSRLVASGSQAQGLVKKSGAQMQFILKHESAILKAALKDPSVLKLASTAVPGIKTNGEFIEKAELLKKEASNALVEGLKELDLSTMRLQALRSFLNDLDARGKSLTEIAVGLDELQADGFEVDKITRSDGEDWQNHIEQAKSVGMSLSETLAAFESRVATELLLKADIPPSGADSIADGRRSFGSGVTRTPATVATQRDVPVEERAQDSSLFKVVSMRLRSLGNALIAN